ncbi:MAG: hypothetical protein KGP06_00915 [Acidobacteria bacterium]|nr:hypothetical protein [Acidobacteriota bacterium]
MFKAIRRVSALFALLLLAIKGVFAFLSWIERTDESASAWVDEDEFEEVS